MVFLLGGYAAINMLFWAPVIIIGFIIYYERERREQVKRDAKLAEVMKLQAKRDEEFRNRSISWPPKEKKISVTIPEDIIIRKGTHTQLCKQ
jgi:hypothetical protein